MARHEKSEVQNIEKSRKRAGASAWPNSMVAAGVAAAGGVGLLAASVIGVGPAAIAGAAGYLAYRGMTDKNEKRAA
jgi:hypothetical protein